MYHCVYLDLVHQNILGAHTFGQSHVQNSVSWSWDFERQVLEHCWETHHVHLHAHPHLNLRYLHISLSLSLSPSLWHRFLPKHHIMCCQISFSFSNHLSTPPALVPPPDDVLMRLQPLFQGQLEEFVMEIQLGKGLVDGILDDGLRTLAPFL